MRQKEHCERKKEKLPAHTIMQLFFFQHTYKQSCVCKKCSCVYIYNSFICLFIFNHFDHFNIDVLQLEDKVKMFWLYLLTPHL